MTQRVDKDSLPLDKPRRTPSHPTKSHIVKTKVDGKERIIRFGEQGASTAGKPKAGESERMKAKRASFKARHAKNIAKGKSSPAYWANRVKWAEGGAVEMNEGGAPPRPRSMMTGLLEQIRDWQTKSRPQAAPAASVTVPLRDEAARISYNPENPFHREAVRLAEKYNLPSNVFLSLVKQESQFNPTARSPKGAYGLTQLMPGTARELGVNPRDPLQNLEGGARYLRQQLDTFGSLPLALAAYNAGPGNVQKHGGIPPFRETQNYVRTILSDAGLKPGFSEGGKVSTYKRLTDTLSKMVSLDTPQDMTAGETVADIAAGFVPGLGTSQAARDFERARREGDKLGMGLAGAGMIPVVGGMVKPGKVAAKSLGELVDQYVRKVRKMDELGPATLSVHRVEAPASAEVPGWHITQDLPGILETGAVKEQKMLQGFYRGYAGDYDAARAAAQDSGVFVSPQRAVGEYYATKRAAQTGLDPHLEMILADPFAGRGYGHSTMGTGKKPPMVTRARELAPEDVKDRTKLYAGGGLVKYNPAHIDAIISGINRPGFAAGGAVSAYDPDVVSALANQVLEGRYV